MPEAEAARLAKLGSTVARRPHTPVGTASGAGSESVLPLPDRRFGHIVLLEDIRQGERIREYEVVAVTPAGEQVVVAGTCVGHKHIHAVQPMTATALRLRVKRSTGIPQVLALAAVASANC